MGAAASDFFTPYADVQHGFLDAELAIEDLHDLAAKGRYHDVSKRLKHGMDPNGKRFFADDAYEREDSPMICAARGHLGNKGTDRHLKTLDVLLKFGADVNQCNVLEQTPLSVACDRNLVSTVAWLVAHGANVNRPDKTGVTPLLSAYRNQNEELVRLLVAHGANVSQPPKRFSCLKFPVLLDEVAAAESSSQSFVSDSDDVDSDEDDRVARQQKALERQQFTQLVSLDLRKRVEQQCVVRDKMLREVEDAMRIDDQRVYRAQLAEQGAKCKQRRRETRARTSYQQFVAKIERKRLEQTPPLEALSAAHLDSQQRHGTAAVSSTVSATTPALLQWEKAAHPRKGGRPRWVSHEGSTTQQQQRVNTLASSATGCIDDSASALIQQCQHLYDSIERTARHRRSQTLVATPKHDVQIGRPETEP